ncbi:unnamed protein product [Porites lobata]|uniref:Uncharacterized protein n=1 Tax=Porites lobata TaxID=104759 RepID=A0ABN8R748_9CNID|nr:unnamed protein product [Porites lobata]
MASSAVFGKCVPGSLETRIPSFVAGAPEMSPLSDLIDKEKGYQNVENSSDNESNNEESSSDIENQEEEEEEEMASENGVEAEGTQESDNDTENDSQETESSSPETSTAFHSKRPVEHCENSIVYLHVEFDMFQGNIILIRNVSLLNQNGNVNCCSIVIDNSPHVNEENFKPVQRRQHDSSRRFCEEFKIALAAICSSVATK